MNNLTFVAQTCRRFSMLAASGLVAALVLLASPSASVGGPPPSTLISQVPLTVAIPAHPQIVLALGNSQSMDGDLSGAIMTGSGSLGGALAANLGASSSPANYTIPAGFTPPVNLGGGGLAPYTVNVGGTLVDNSGSRLNVAKAGITALLNSFMAYADFALMDYSTGGVGVYTTWAYYMSPSGSNFTFAAAPGAGEVANPCYNANVALPDAYSQSCAAMLANFGAGSGIISLPYMNVGATSDDPLINDVFYAPASYQPPVCAQGTPNPGDPYTTYGLGTYEARGVTEFYNVLWGPAGYSWPCDPGTSPTNAGYVPYSPQVMQVERGFGYDASTQSAITGRLSVAMQSSGNSPTAGSVAAAIAPFTQFLQPETNNLATAEVKAVAEQAPTAGLVKGAALYFSTTNPPSTNACAPARYIVLLTDGLPTKDLAGNQWPPLGTSAATGYGVSATFNGNLSLNATNDQALIDTIAQITRAYGQGVKTYVIGLGAGVDPSNNPLAASTLSAMAVAGGTGNFFAARSPTELTNDMQVILTQILVASQSNASTTVNTTSLNTTSMAYQPSFTTSDIDQDWTGDMKAYPINPATGMVNTGALAWSGQTQLDAQAAGTGWQSRIIATWDPVAGAGTPFEWSAGTPPDGIATSTALGAQLETSTTDPSGQDALDYLRGDQALMVANGGTYRNRTHILADVIDSAPLYIGAVRGPYQSNSYFTFEHAYANRAPVIYAGANDGMLHAFSATTGNELFAYIPNGVFSNLIRLTNPYYNEQHRFYVDGSPQAADVQFSDGSWHTELVSGERAGGNTIFALDVTNPATITSEASLASSVLWEFSDPNMGMSLSTPAIAPTAAGASGPNLGFTVFFGNGYNSPSQTPYLYALDPKTGTSLPGTPINLCAVVPTACNASLPNGLSSVVVTNILGAVGAPATTLYAGDLQGNLWRVDIHDPNPNNWVVTLLFQATDPSGQPQPITTTPAVSLNPDFPLLAGTLVYVGTGQMLGTPDLTSTQVQTMYGVYDTGSNPAPLARANLVPQIMSTSVVGGTTLRMVSGTQVALPSQDGWYVDFDLLSGERVVTDPRLVGGALTVISVQPLATIPTAMAIKPRDKGLGIMPSGSRPAPSMLARTRPNTRQHLREQQQPLPSLDHSIAAATSADRVVDVGTGPMRGDSTAARLWSVPLDQSNAAATSADRVVDIGTEFMRGDSTGARLWPVVLGVAPPPTLVSLSVSPASATIVLGFTQQFFAIGHYSDGSTQNLTAVVSWSSADTTVATVGVHQGLATSTGLGTTTITATLGLLSASGTLTVVPAGPPPPPPTLLSITVTPANPTNHVGQTLQFAATGNYSDGSRQNLTALVTWSSSNTGVATIAASGGLATSVALGNTTITATLGGISGSTGLTVVPWPTLVSIVVTPAIATINVGQNQRFTATGVYSDGSTANLTGSSAWSSSNVAVATVAGGLASGSSAGTTTITATHGAHSGNASLTVVTPPPPPPPAICPGGEVSYLMEFNFAGGAFKVPVFNYNGVGTVTTALVPANGVLLGNVYASAPIFTDYSGGGSSGGAIGLVTLSNTQIASFYQIGLNRSRFSWWEVR